MMAQGRIKFQDIVPMNAARSVCEAGKLARCPPDGENNETTGTEHDQNEKARSEERAFMYMPAIT